MAKLFFFIYSAYTVLSFVLYDSQNKFRSLKVQLSTRT